MIFLAAALFGNEQEATKRTYAHLLIHDPFSAIQEAQKGLLAYPDSKPLRLAYIRALSEKGDEVAMLQEWAKAIAIFPDEVKDRLSLGILAWGVLNKGHRSDQLMIKLNSLLGAAFTHDVRATPLLLEAMRGTNAMLRNIAIKLSALYGDGPLRLELGRLLKEEKVWYVRLEVIQAIGALRILALREELKEIVGNSETLAEEKAAAILALVAMYDAANPAELKGLIKNFRAGFRQLACELILHLNLTEEAPLLIPLLTDASPDVRMEALYTLGLLKTAITEEQLHLLLNDTAPQVAITAAWYATLQGRREGPQSFSRRLHDSRPEWRHLAAAALSASGKNGIPLARREMRSHSDHYVRANLALGCIGQREDVEDACATLFSTFFGEEQTLWMWNEHTLFRSLVPSTLSHTPQIPNYPKIVDQLTRLEILSLLSILRAPQAQEAVKGFLKNNAWGVAGTAAVALLTEGDEEALSLVRGLLEEKDPKIRVQAALVLGMFGGDRAAVKVLQEAYPFADREMRVHIVEALGRIGDTTSIPFLVDILKEPFQMLRVVAASALIQCLYH